MCAVSAISDYYTRTFPERFPGAQSPFGQAADPDTKAMMGKVLELLEKIDKKLGDVECKDEAKKEFLAQFEQQEGANA